VVEAVVQTWLKKNWILAICILIGLVLLYIAWEWAVAFFVGLFGSQASGLKLGLKKSNEATTQTLELGSTADAAKAEANRQQLEAVKAQIKTELEILRASRTAREAAGVRWAETSTATIPTLKD